MNTSQFFYPPEDDLLSIAFHEAGHAVAAFALGVPVRLASIVPDEDGAPHVIWAKIQDFCWQNRVIILLAGGIAQRHHNPESRRGDADDLQQAVDTIDRLARPNDHRKWFAALAQEAEDIITRWWPAVEALAEALMQQRTMSGREVTACILKTGADAEQCADARQDYCSVERSDSPEISWPFSTIGVSAGESPSRQSFSKLFRYASSFGEFSSSTS